MIRQWEEFEIGPKEPTTNLHVTLNKKGQLLIGARAFERLGNPEAAVLLFDKINHLIGIMPSHSRVANAYPLKRKAAGYGYRFIGAYRFCRHHGIRVDRTVAFNDVKIDEEGILELNLKTTTAIGK